MLIDTVDQVAIEIRDNDAHGKALDGPDACTNHHLALGGQADHVSTSHQRLAAARRYIATVATLDEVFALLRRHDEGDTGICNHSAHETVYSYVLRRRDRQTTLCVIQGKPCESSSYQELELPLGSLWSADAAAAFQSGYPSRVELAG